MVTNKRKVQCLLYAFENDTLSANHTRFTGNSGKMYLKSAIIVAEIRTGVKFDSQESQPLIKVACLFYKQWKTPKCVLFTNERCNNINIFLGMPIKDVSNFWDEFFGGNKASLNSST